MHFGTESSLPLTCQKPGQTLTYPIVILFEKQNTSRPWGERYVSHGSTQIERSPVSAMKTAFLSYDL
jgi:hypothetical protein